MKNSTKLYVAFILLAAGVLWFTSCSSEDGVQSAVVKNDASLTLTINTGKTGTRATSWDGSSTPQKTDENTVNRLTIGIFNSDGSKVRTIVELTPSTTGGNSLTVSGNTATAKIVTTSLAAGDQVLVAVNAPTGKFQGVQNVSDFNAKTEEAEEALTDRSDKTKESNKNIPMYGATTLAGSGASFTASVDAYHLLAKISLDDLEVAFDANGAYKNAEFTPTAFYLINVPKTLMFNGTIANDYNEAWTSTTNWLHGWGNEDFTSANTAASSMGTYAQYLTTGSLTPATALKGTSATYSSKAYFYTMPNSNDGDNKTKLIIEGKFKANSSASEETVYYPVAINANYDANGTASAAGGTDKFKVYPNKNYVCKVVIKTKGADSPNSNLDPQTATITVTVKDFVDANQTTIFE